MVDSHVASAVQAIVATYRKAPVTFSLFASYFVSQLVSTLWHDYRLFLSLPGGPLPKNLFGWAVHFALYPLSLHRSFTGRKLVRSYLPTTRASQAGELSTGIALPRRAGSAPRVAGTIPHRQLDQFSSSTAATPSQDAHEPSTQTKAAVDHILTTFQHEADAQPSHLRLGPSLIEAHSTALFAVSHTLVTGSDTVSRSTRSAQFPCALARRFLSSVRGELAHVHCSNIAPAENAELDGSLHVTLNPDDAALVVEQGWGELHPLAGFPSYSGFWMGWPAWLADLRWFSMRSARWWTSTSVPTAADGKIAKAVGLPPSYCLVYSPRNEDEAKVINDIVRAAIAFAVGPRPPR